MPQYLESHGRVRDLHELPKMRDRLTYLYLEHGRLDKSDQSIAFWTEEGKTAIPVASLAVLMLGPGVRVTHAAMMALADNNCLAIWCGEQGVRFYSWGTGGTRSSAALLRQAKLWADEEKRLAVVRRMYEMRFSDAPGERVSSEMTLQQLRGREGLRVRSAYEQWSAQSGVPWEGRSYDRNKWQGSDPVNRALSAANACLYGLCHAAILSVGYSPALGFVHTGKQLSFVYDVADLYKLDVTVPVAFQIAAENPANIDRETRLRCRDVFRDTRLLERLVPDMRHALLDDVDEEDEDFALDTDPAMPTEWWGDAERPVGGVIVGRGMAVEDAAPGEPPLKGAEGAEGQASPPGGLAGSL